MPFLNELEGKSLAGYALTRLLRSEPGSAWYATQSQNKAATAFVAERPREEDSLIASLEAVSRVKHSNVVAIERVGRAKIDGVPVVYAIEESTEENLAEVLRERPLTTDETTQIIDSLVGGLSALHEQGLLHGNIAPANIFAVGDTVKLRSDCVQKLTTAAKSNQDAYGQDIGDMGALVFESLTQRKLMSAEDPAIARLPAPFGSIVASAVTGRWGLTDISTALRKQSTAANHPVPATAKAAVGAPVASPSTASPSIIDASKAAAARIPPVKATPPARPVPASAVAETEVEEPAARRNPAIRVVAILAIVAALAIFYYFYRKSTQAPNLAQSGAQSDTQSADQPATAPPSPAQQSPADASGPTPAKNDTAPKAAASEAAPRAASTSSDAAVTAATQVTGSHKVWRVVVYTYGHEAEAQKKAAAMIAAHPDLKAEEFSPNGHGPYLVTVGGPMEKKEEAVRFREKAVAEGLPRDSYAQNYRH